MRTEEEAIVRAGKLGQTINWTVDLMTLEIIMNSLIRTLHNFELGEVDKQVTKTLCKRVFDIIAEEDLYSLKERTQLVEILISLDVLQ